MKDMTKKKAPRVPIAPREKPFAFFKENGKANTRKSPQAPLKAKRLAK